MTKYFRKTIALLLFAQVFLLPIIFSYYTYESFEATKFSVLFLGNVLLFVLAVIVWRRLRFSKIHIILGLFLGYSLLTLLWARNVVAGSRWLLFWGNYFLWSVVVYNSDISRAKLKYVIYGAATIVITLAIGQALGYDYSTVFEGGRVFSTLSNPNFLSNFMMLIALYAGVNFFENIREWVSAAISLLSLLVIFLAQTRGAFLGFFIGLLFYLGARHFFKKRIHNTLFILVLILVFGAVGYVKLAPRFAGGFKESNVSYRLFIWRCAVSLSAEHPLGTGVDNFFMYYPFYQAQYRKVSFYPKNFGVLERRLHNEYLQVLAEEGVLGLALVLLAMLVGLRSFDFRRGGHIAVVGFLVHSFFSFPAHLSTSLLYFTLFVSCSDWNKNREKDFALAAAGFRQILVRAVFIGVAVLNILVIPRYFWWQTWYKTASYYSGAKDFVRAEYAFKRALRFGKRIGYINHDFGYVLSYLGKWRQAKIHFLLAWKYNPSDTARINLGNCYYMTRRYFYAYKYYKAGLELNPQKESGRKNLEAVKRIIQRTD